jgi:aryl-alcohol dehydrogenase-like predicted oxidoreductase
VNATDCKKQIDKESDMNNAELGKTGAFVSQVSLGCMLMGSTISKKDSFAALDRFTEMGGDFLDTANCYAWWIGKGEFIGDESETILGQWMKERGNRDKVFLATKVGARLRNPRAIRDADGNVFWDRVEADRELLAPQVIRRGVEDSLRRLQTDYIDLYYAHIDDRLTPLEETLETFNTLVKEGKVRFIGCSNFRTWRIERANQISALHGWAKFAAIQQQYSYLRPKAGADFGVAVNVDDELLDYLKTNDEITLLPYSPLLKGIYDDAQKREAYYNWHLFNNDDACARLEVLSGMAMELNISNSQLVLAWLLHHQPKTIPILGFSNLDQLDQNLKALDVSLCEEQMNILNKASA